VEACRATLGTKSVSKIGVRSLSFDRNISVNRDPEPSDLDIRDMEIIKGGR
jgi:hypothetical protein